MSIRPYKPTDFDALLTVFRNNVPDAFGAGEEADYVDFLGRLPVPYVVYEQDGRVLGACGHYVPTGQPVGQIVWIVADPATRGKGVGSALLTYCLDAMQQAGVRQIDCRTSQVAYRFFERFGFRLQYVKTDYWAPGFDLYFMTREL